MINATDRDSSSENQPLIEDLTPGEKTKLQNKEVIGVRKRNPVLLIPLRTVLKEVASKNLMSDLLV